MSIPGPSEGNRGDHDLAPMRGCLIGIMVGAILWAVIIAAAALIWGAVSR